MDIISCCILKFGVTYTYLLLKLTQHFRIIKIIIDTFCDIRVSRKVMFVPVPQDWRVFLFFNWFLRQKSQIVCLIYYWTHGSLKCAVEYKTNRLPALFESLTVEIVSSLTNKSSTKYNDSDWARINIHLLTIAWQ